MNASSPRSVLDFIGETIATFFGVGHFPFAPGTAGSLAALPLCWFIWMLPLPIAFGIAIAIFFLGVWGASVVIRRTGVSDHSSIVIDEVAGMLLITSIASHLWWHYILAFFLFRIFDVWKPWPVRWIDRQWKGPFGAMMDDVFASAFATLLFYILLRYSSVMVSPGIA